jgi:BirA family biotin operon repressor/biotin-[acetyl-CoA-carboxylase] ligase
MKHKLFIEYIHKESTASTMLDAVNLIKTSTDSPDRFVIIVGEQTGGMGREQNIWLSPKGGLWFTYGFKAAGILQQVSLLLGYCLHKVLTDSFPCLKESLMIKWPNDLIINNRKLSGILVQHQNGYLLIGIGINTNNDILPIDTFFEPVSLKQSLGFDVSNKAILERFISKFETEFQIMRESSFLNYVTYVNTHLLGYGKKISFDTGKGVIKSVCKGINEEGALVLETIESETTAYFSGSIISVGN